MWRVSLANRDVDRNETRIEGQLSQKKVKVKRGLMSPRVSEAVRHSFYVFLRPVIPFIFHPLVSIREGSTRVFVTETDRSASP